MGSSHNLKTLYRISLYSSVVMAGMHIATAQTASNDIHVKQWTAASSADTSTAKAAPTIKVDVNLVLVPVTVTDEMDRLITGLEKDNFQVFEDKRLQAVQHLSSIDAPVSIGVIFDSSSSMSDKIDRAREAVRQFLRTANPDDELLLISLADQPTELVDFTNNTEDIENGLLFATPKGSTALLDAIYLGVAKMRTSKYSRKALLIISDGGNNHSRYTERDVMRVVKESDITIYSIGVYSYYFSSEEERLGPELLSDISNISGGRSFTIDTPNDLPEVATKIGVELRNQYLLGYRPDVAHNDGKWHKIKVKVLPPKGLPRLQLHARQGYYAHEE